MRKLSIAIGSLLAVSLGVTPLLAQNPYNNGNMTGSYMAHTKIDADDIAKATGDVDINTTATANLPCVQASVQTRDTALIDAFNAYSQSVATALKTKEDAEVSAWAITDVNQRGLALVAAEKTFTSSYNSASLQLNKAKDAARAQFKTAVHACVTHASSSSSNNSSNSSSSSSTSSIIACQNPTGTLSGTFSVENNAIVDAGKAYTVSGSGSIGTIGSVTATGSLQSLGFISSGHATGTITLINGTDRAVLHLQGQTQAGFSPLPATFSYSVQNTTGVFTQMRTTGTASLHLTGTTSGTFRLELHANCDRND